MFFVSKLFNRAHSPRKLAHICLLSRSGCHLCDDALVALEREFGAEQIDVIDITSDPRLEDLYVFRIPVVLFDDQVVVEGIIGKTEARHARRLIDQTTRAGSSPA